MRCVIFLFLFIKTVSSSSNWIRFESKCFQKNIKHVNRSTAIEICQQNGAVLTSVSNQKEMDFLGSILKPSEQYWVWLTFKDGRYQWEDGQSCCPRSWWSPTEPSHNDTCARLYRIKGSFQLWDMQCGSLYGFICSKAAKVWTLVSKNDYYFDELCGVEIMPNCKGHQCEDVCQSHHDCTQFAKMSNLYIISLSLSLSHGDQV
ncbi:MRC [Acanthosepion pharaonis]|uniref:MRC n=1 Tax=Acanthosepion pharaonis TaxID=158019 RepID=A0A812CFU3_ACAPH|nr:MRC [Sepia pharaonis]